MRLRIEARGGLVRFRVKVQPRARRDEIAGTYGDALRVRVTAPPVGGRANHALVDLLAERLRVTRSSIKIAAGAHAALKVIEVTGLDPDTIVARLCPDAAPSTADRAE